MNIFAKNYEIEGPDIPMPERGAARFFAVFFSHFWKLICVNILFVVFSLPVVTMPASLCAMNRVLIKLVREGNVMLWQEFRDEFKADLLSSILPGFLFGMPIFSGYFFIRLALANAEYAGMRLTFWSLGICLLLFSICIGEYYFVMKAELDLSGKDLLKNAVLLSLATPLPSLLSFAVAVIFMLVSAALMPVSILLIFFAFPVLAQYIVCFILNNVIQEKIITPYEQMNSHQDNAD